MQMKCKQFNKFFNIQSLLKRQNNNVRNIIYYNIVLFRFEFDRKKKFQIIIKFD